MTDGTTPYVRPDVAAFLAFLNAQEGPKMEEMPPEAGREMMRVMGQMADVPRGAIAKVEDRPPVRFRSASMTTVPIASPARSWSSTMAAAG